MRQYLEQSVSAFLERQDAFQGVMQEFMETTSPMNVFNQMMEKNMNIWQNFTAAGTVKPEASGGKDTPSEEGDEPTSNKPE